MVDLLTTLNDRCVEAFDVDAAGVMLAADGTLQVVASSSDDMRVLELFELQADEGPCVDCYRSGTPIVNLELEDGVGPWPRFSPRAIACGFRSVHSLPMRLRDRTIGALNMFRTGTGALADDDVTAAQALADIATIAIIQHGAADDAHALNAELSGALNTCVAIEQPKGRIAEASGIDMDQAFGWLRHYACARTCTSATSPVTSPRGPSARPPSPRSPSRSRH